jgi:hypothetical protein
LLKAPFLLINSDFRGAAARSAKALFISSILTAASNVFNSLQEFHFRLRNDCQIELICSVSNLHRITAFYVHPPDIGFPGAI